MRVLITGSNGLLGQKLLATLGTSRFDLFGCDLQESPFVQEPEHSYHRTDITDKGGMLKLVQEIKPDVIIHTAAMTNVDRCETDRSLCWGINVIGTETITTAAGKVGAKLLYISTDYVFDGIKQSYNEQDTPKPLSYYGRSKLAGENAVRGAKTDWAIVRTVVLYGHGISPKASFISWLEDMLRNGREVNIVTDQISNMTFVDDLAVGIESVILREFNGIVNMGGAEVMSRWDFARIVAEQFGYDTTLIKPINTADLNQPAKRPLRSVLDITLARNQLGYDPRPVAETVSIYKQQMRGRQP